MIARLIVGILVGSLLSTNLYAETLKFYCGTTMAKAMAEIALEIEKKHGVKIELIKSGSAKLYKQLAAEKDGDLYLPGSDSYIKKNKKEGYLGYSKFVGFNQAAILVQKGNPKGVKSLDDFISDDINVIIGAPQSGSIGKAAKSVLIKYKDKAYYDLVAKRATLAEESSAVAQALLSGDADAAISWKASAYGKDIDIVEIPSNIAAKKRLKITLLSFSKNKEVAKDLINFAASTEGKVIMNKYGFR